MVNLKSLQACNPSHNICAQKEPQYYVNLANARGEDIVKKMRRVILLSPNKPTYQVLSGHIGNGKTTELLRLKLELEQQGFVVVYIAAVEHLQIDDVSLSEIWLVMLTFVLKQLEKKADTLALSYLPNAIAELEKYFRLSSPLGTSAYVSRLHHILQTLQDIPQLRSQLHNYVESRLKGLLIAALEEVIAIEVDQLKQLSKKGLVIMIDNLDRLSLSQTEIIFSEGGKYLRQFQCHTIYTFPTLVAETEAKLQHLMGNIVIHLANLSLCDRQGNINEQSLNLLRQIVLARLLPDVKTEQLMEQVNEAFDDITTLDQLCCSSYGHLNYLISLLYGCCQRQDPPLDADTIREVLESAYQTRLSTISDRDWQEIDRCLSDDYILTTSALNLCRRLILFIHHDSQGSWFVSPFIKAMTRHYQPQLYQT